MAARSQRDRSWSARSTSWSSSPSLDAWRASVSRMRASRPATSASPGSSVRSMRARSSDRSTRSRRHRSAPLGCRVPGREEQVHDREHGVDAGGKLVDRRHPVGNPSNGDLLLGAGDAGRHGRLADQKRPADLAGSEPAHQAERERHLRVEGDGWVAAREDEPQPVVDDIGLVHLTGPRRRSPLRSSNGRVRSMGHAPPSNIDGAASGDGGQPGAGFRAGSPRWTRWPGPGRRHPGRIPRPGRCRL